MFTVNVEMGSNDNFQQRNVWLLNGGSRVPASLNGTGTRWYGHALPHSDGSWVVTEWVTVFWLPILPIGSKRILGYASSDGDTKPRWSSHFGDGHYTVARAPLHIPHVLKGYAVTLGLALIAAIVLFRNG